MAVNQSKIPGSWISSSFETCATDHKDFQGEPPSRKRSRDVHVLKRKSSSIQLRGKAPKKDYTIWAERYSPQTKEELAVHKKKVSEVEDWLKDSLNKHSNFKNGASLLLLTGPPGVGKTATVQALSRDLGLEVKEWSNSSETANQTSWLPDQARFSNSNLTSYTYESQSSLFRNFLLRANKYPPLFSLCTKQIVLIEEFPNAFFKDASTFREIIRKFHRTGRSPLIFIVSDCTTGESAEHHLFPKDFQQELNIKNISFNPVAPTMLLRVLNRINADANSSSQKRLSKAELEAISSDSMGDIRNAINSLQFLCAPKSLKYMTDKIVLSKERKSSASNSDEHVSSGNRDSSLFLFHALGKILYCKRDPLKTDEINKLPPHLSHLARFPLQANPEEVFRKTAISEEGFTLFLHQNYPPFVEDIKVAAECSSWLSEAEILTVEWSERQTMNSYAASLAMRGLMFNLTPSPLGNRWRPLHKPQLYSHMKNNHNLTLSVKNAFKGKQISLRELQVEFIPYLSKIGIPLQTSEQTRVVSQIGSLPIKNVFRHQPESLYEKEPYEIDVEENSMNAGKTEAAVVIQEEESSDEIIIEEFDI